MRDAAGEAAAALAALEAALRSHAHPAAALLRPGLDPAQVRSLVTPVGLALPDAAVAVWAWHDGVESPGCESPARAQLLPGGALLFRLDEAIRQYDTYRAIAPDRDDWSPAWFPLARHFNDSYWLDCSGPVDGPTPVQYRYTWEYSPPAALAAQRVGSLPEAVAAWVGVLDSGAWAIDEATDRYDWLREPEGLPRAFLGLDAPS
ncbi:MAG TPA: hypothetical protein VFJ85_07985 [Acidimicrobiales bacterium]|nr:hypothetical protein [Acidimicrobiales bacterium]